MKFLTELNLWLRIVGKAGSASYLLHLSHRFSSTTSSSFPFPVLLNSLPIAMLYLLGPLSLLHQSQQHCLKSGNIHSILRPILVLEPSQVLLLVAPTWSQAQVGAWCVCCVLSSNIPNSYRLSQGQETTCLVESVWTHDKLSAWSICLF